MGDAPAVVRVFWPHPSLPRISGVGGGDARSAETGDVQPALVLVGWWRANARRDEDADDRDGARPAVSSVDVVVAGAAVSAGPFENYGPGPGTGSLESLGPPVVLGSLVPPHAARSFDSANPRPTRKPGREESGKSHARAPPCPVRLLARLKGPRSSPDRDVDDARVPESGRDFLTATRNKDVPIDADDILPLTGAARVVVVRYATPKPPGVLFGSRHASAPYAWVLRAANEAGRLANSRTVAPQTDSASSFAIPKRARACASLVARALEAKWIPGLRRRHAWLAPRRQRASRSDSDSDSDSDSGRDDAETRARDGKATSKNENDETERRGTTAPGSKPTRTRRRREGVVYRDACEVFASAKVIRSRARWIARGGDAPSVPADVRALCPSLRRAFLFGRALQVFLDLLLGFALRKVLLANADALVAFAAGDDVVWIPNEAAEGVFSRLGLGRFVAAARDARAKTRTPPLGDLIRNNAEWLMRGSPLGVKLHAPLARALGAAAMALVEALGAAVSTRPFRRFIRACVAATARVGPLGGASLSLALAADLTTFLTTHVAALHVYSSLLVTAQWTFGKKLVAVVARNETVESATFGVLALTPLGLLFPTTLAFYLSYLAAHAFTVFARASLVLAAAAAQHAPLEAVVARLTHPSAFPGEPDVRDVRRDGEAGETHALVLTCRPAGAFDAAVAPFASAAARWIGGTARATARACVSLGRLPVALVPFEPERAELFER